jgi:DNA-binding transcriptional ArsR family regulator
MKSASASQLVAWLRAAGEPSRLRLLALCTQGDLSVSDLAQALGQSEPRVSRHLRILCEAGLLQRLRQGQWVHYRVAANPVATSFVQGLLAQLDRQDPQLSRDLDRAQGQPSNLSDSAKTSESRLGRALTGFVEGSSGPVLSVTADGGARAAAAAGGAGVAAKFAKGSGTAAPGSALVIGVEHLELLERAAAMAGGCVAIAHSRRAAQSARAFAERRRFNCRVLLAGTGGLSERDIARAGQSFDVVIVDHLATPDLELTKVLGLGRRALNAGGRLWLFERYESLETSREKVKVEFSRERAKVVEHPLARLRRLLGEWGLSCERLSPIEADGEHVLAAVAAPVANTDETTLRRA